MRAYGTSIYCYNLGNIEYIGEKPEIGGIVGTNNNINNDKLEKSKSKVLFCYNSGNISSLAKVIGGITGFNNSYCEVKDCYVYSGAKVQYNGTDATENIGSSTNNYLGKIIGNQATNAVESNNGTLDEMPTVYYVVNGLSNEKSDYWSNTNLDEPKLLWEK